MQERFIAAPLNRIPGTSQLKQQNSKDLKTLNYDELLEMRDRQAKFLTFKKRLQQLPDQGKRLQESYAKLLAEIERRNDVEAAAQMFSELNIAAKGKIALNNLEWRGQEDAHVADILDSDDELEMDPLKIIAQGTMHEKKVKVLPPLPSLITDQDLAEIETFKQSSSRSEASSSPMPLDQHALYLIDKTEAHVEEPSRAKFRPFRTTLSNVHDPEKERVRKMGKHWEITAATPPLIRHKEVQLVPLVESANLQMDYMQRIKELRLQQAEQRLSKSGEAKILPGLTLPSESILKTKESFKNYRNPQVDYLIEGKQKKGEQQEVLDPTLTDGGAASGINYTIYE